MYVTLLELLTYVNLTASHDSTLPWSTSVFQSSVIDRQSRPLHWRTTCGSIGLDAEAMRWARNSRRVSEVFGADASSLKGIIGRDEGADGRCWHKIFGDIFFLAG